jgi:sporulation protein YlmC with PRC-barrel domain
MLYFSELKGKIVMSEDGIKIGKLDDLIFLATDNPLITKLVIINQLKEELLVPIKFLNKINHILVLEKSYQVEDLKDNEIYIDKNLVDTQIIDLVGNKIVRVNDVRFRIKELY